MNIQETTTVPVSEVKLGDRVQGFGMILKRVIMGDGFTFENGDRAKRYYPASDFVMLEEIEQPLQSLPTLRDFLPGKTPAKVLAWSWGSMYFSYETLVAIGVFGGGSIIIENKWGPTTGRHLNAIPIDVPRLPAAEFNTRAAEIIRDQR